MPVRVGFLSTAHMHAWGYAAGVQSNPHAQLAGFWDDDAERAKGYADHFQAPFFPSKEALFDACDAIVICSENRRHVEHVESAANAGKPVLCEKPLVTTEAEWQAMEAILDRSGAKLMTAFPCRYSPAFKRLRERIGAGEIGKLVGICATNRGRNPGGWFIQPELSGGGAMIDHVVHVTDLVRVLLNQNPQRVHAFTGNNMYGQDWEDTAMLTLEFADGFFVSLDSSWSRPKSYKTWGDVTMNVVGEWGVIELDLFNQALDVYSDANGGHGLAGYGSDIDAGLLADFIDCVRNDTPPPITAEDGWRASQVALAGYESAKTGQAVTL